MTREAIDRLLFVAGMLLLVGVLISALLSDQVSASSGRRSGGACTGAPGGATPPADSIRQGCKARTAEVIEARPSK